ncbi:hypothetical protein Y032_0004g1943 [Ancylostoma ceylanicum]|uniref:NTR domain-containing protein n=1 Tax=Ancylostoma ceylanicum TaxID=53326 RepID=A0A016VVP4_9BILA|nr:hypothetical protein Y032_0004g1943 [Ancylostoma ceylanicum]
MWCLVALLTCIGVVQAAPRNEQCPQKIFFNFAIEAEIIRKNDDDPYLTEYELKDTEVNKTRRGTEFGNKVYTNKEPLPGSYAAVLAVNSRYILKGKFGGEDGEKPIVTACEVKEIAKRERNKPKKRVTRPLISGRYV